MEHPVMTAIQLAAFTPLGWFATGSEDKLPGNARIVILIGNAGPAMFHRFMAERSGEGMTLDEWTRTSVSRLAEALEAVAVYPFDVDPPWPFLTWARRAGAGHISPLGLNIHPTYGLWHAFRAALLIPVPYDLPGHSLWQNPCETCEEKPCLAACPVSAFSGDRYDVIACARHIDSAQGTPCLTNGCLARHACPVGQEFAYAPAQAEFHMRAFLAARQKG